MKAQRIRILHPFLTRKVGDILQLRKDISETLVNEGKAEWVTVEVTPEPAPVVDEIIIFEPKKAEVVKEAIMEPEKPVDPKKQKAKPKPAENKAVKNRKK
jgi:outer membrane biosynthesis protein TonB